jgi:Glycosyl transferase family 11.
MKFVALTGGLGNQMFIYAFCEGLRAKGYKSALFIQHRTNQKAYGHQGYELEKLFDVKPYQGLISIMAGKLVICYSHLLRFFPVRWRVTLFKLIGIHVVSVSENFIYYPEPFSFAHKNELFKGTWQSQMYFEDAIPAVRKAFVFKEDLLSLNSRNVAGQMNKEQSVSIHIRRGDYLSEQYANGFAGVCSPEYYEDAINYIKKNVDSPYFYVFTDDKEWVSKNFKLENATYINHNTGKDSWQDMYLMSQCKHNIIANSSFSWWGAWLNDNSEKIVIAPKKWWRLFEHDDVVPAEWLRL